MKQAFEDRKKNGIKIADGSLEAQKNRAIEYIQQISSQLKREYEIISILEDTKSAKNTDRDGYQKLEEAVEQGKVDWIVTSEISRLHRDTLEFLSFRKFCKKYSVELLYIGAPYGVKDDSTELVETFMAAMAEFERKQTASRLRKNIISRLKSTGKINGAEPILGLDKCPLRKGHFIINEEEVRTLKKLMEIYLISTGEADTLRIAHESGLRDKNGRYFTSSRFKNILKNVEWRYSGKWYVQEPTENSISEVLLDHGEVINGELRKRVLERTNALCANNIKRGKHNHVYLLSHLLKSKDGFSFSGQIGHGRSEDYRYYYCRDLKLRLDASALEEVIEKRVVQYAKQSSLFKELVRSGLNQKKSTIVKLQKEISLDRSELSRLESKINSLVNLLTNPQISSESIKAISNQLDELHLQKEKRLGQIKFQEGHLHYLLSNEEVTTAEEQIEKYANELRKLSRTQKRELLESIFEKIEVLDPYFVKFHMKRPAELVANELVLKNGCDSVRSGGTSRT